MGMSPDRTKVLQVISYGRWGMTQEKGLFSNGFDCPERYGMHNAEMCTSITYGIIGDVEIHFEILLDTAALEFSAASFSTRQEITSAALGTCAGGLETHPFRMNWTATPKII